MSAKADIGCMTIEFEQCILHCGKKFPDLEKRSTQHLLGLVKELVKNSNPESIFHGLPCKLTIGQVIKKIEENSLNKETTESLIRSVLCSKARQPRNVNYNRYANVLPYDDSTINLSGGRYINASPIEFPSDSIKYIATQMPMENTIHHFWEMVKNTGCSCIVNLVPLEEMSSTPYFPSKQRDMKIPYSDFYVSCVDSQEIFSSGAVQDIVGYVHHLNFFTQSTHEMRSVKIFHFLTWQDKNVPPSPYDMKGFVERLDQENTGAGPIVVHCTAGIGRTGAFIALHSILHRIGKEGPDFMDTKNPDIDFVSERIFQMRNQRYGMVQTAKQYQFVCIMIHEKLTEIEGLQTKSDSSDNSKPCLSCGSEENPYFSPSVSSSEGIVQE